MTAPCTWLSAPLGFTICLPTSADTHTLFTFSALSFVSVISATSAK